MENPERRQPKNIENVRDRFMDFIGNPLNGILGCLDTLQEEDLPSERQQRLRKGLNDSWNDFFQRIEMFRDGG